MINTKMLNSGYWMALIALVGCATFFKSVELQPGAEEVRFFMTEQQNCTFISELTALYEERWAHEETDEKARILIKNEAHAKGANAFVIVMIDRKPHTQTERGSNSGYTKIFGNAYKCRF